MRESCADGGRTYNAVTGSGKQTLDSTRLSIVGNIKFYFEWRTVEGFRVVVTATVFMGDQAGKDCVDMA